MVEKRLIAVPPQLFTSNGTANGVITVTDTRLFKVKQLIILKSNTASPSVDLEIKRIPNATTIEIGPKSGNIDARSNLSAYLVADGASIFANEQFRPKVPSEEFNRAVYEEEPTVAIRSALVDRYGNKIDSVQDNHGVNRLAVDGQFTAEVDVQVDVDVDGYYDAVDNPDPDNIGLIAHTRSENTDETNQIQRVTAKRGTLDEDTVSMDVSLHDSDGNAFSPAKPLPVFSTYEKFISLASSSAWMKLGVYDEVTPSIVGSDLVLTYKEDSAILGTAVISNYLSVDGWSLKLNRYIADDDGTILYDDDGITPLNLD